MSLFAFQTAIASLIRCPKDNRHADLKSFLEGLELNEQEFQLIQELAQHPELNKYGKEQAYQRWEYIESHVVRLFNFVDDQLLEELWFKRFEPQAMQVEADHRGRYAYSLAFLQFLLNDSFSRELIEKNSFLLLEI